MGLPARYESKIFHIDSEWRPVIRLRAKINLTVNSNLHEAIELKCEYHDQKHYHCTGKNANGHPLTSVICQIEYFSLKWKYFFLFEILIETTNFGNFNSRRMSHNSLISSNCTVFTYHFSHCSIQLCFCLLNFGTKLV